MEQFIREQADLFLDSLYTGLVIMASYDILRLLRRIIKHKNIFVSIEDFLFWVIAGFVMFYIIYSENNGGLRWYIAFGVCLGGTVYEKSFGKFLVKYLSLYINKILNIILKKIISKAIMSIRYIIRRVVVDNGKKLRKKEKIK